MIDLNYIKAYYPPIIAENQVFTKHILKEYVELLALDHIFTQSPFAQNLSFIGGTNLRLTMGIDRFSEDLNFDCKNLTEEDFIKLTDSVADMFRLHGYNVETRERENPNLKAFRRSIYFPELLYSVGLSPHREARFLLKIEAQDQKILYDKKNAVINKCGFYINVPTPPEDILLSMKLCALLSRAKGRDFYDVMFLLNRVDPHYGFLETVRNIKDENELKEEISALLDGFDLNMKRKDFQHLLINSSTADRILDFAEYIDDNIKTSHSRHK